MSRDELMKKAAECDLGRVVGPLDTLLDDEWEALHRFVEFCGRDELTREQARSQMYADLVRAIAVVLHGDGYSDTSKLPAEVEALRADAWRNRWPSTAAVHPDAPAQAQQSTKPTAAPPARCPCGYPQPCSKAVPVGFCRSHGIGASG